MLKEIDAAMQEWEQANSNLSEEECHQLNLLLDKLRTQ
jgi:hypothetical protein